MGVLHSQIHPNKYSRNDPIPPFMNMSVQHLSPPSTWLTQKRKFCYNKRSRHFNRCPHLNLFQSIPHNAQIPFQLRDESCNLFRVAQDLDTLCVRVVSYSKWSMGRLYKLPDKEVDKEGLELLNIICYILILTKIENVKQTF